MGLTPQSRKMKTFRKATVDETLSEKLKGQLQYIHVVQGILPSWVRIQADLLSKSASQTSSWTISLSSGEKESWRQGLFRLVADIDAVTCGQHLVRYDLGGVEISNLRMVLIHQLFT